jgi:hypothetical protein
MPEVLEGSQTGLTVNNIIVLLAQDVGYNVGNTRFQGKVKNWINETLRDIQIQDPKMRRTVVHEATGNTIAGVAEYDVRKDPADGGFGWTNCREVLSLLVPLLSDLPLERIGLERFRSRGEALGSVTGPPHSFVIIDGFRIRMDPTPDGIWALTGDYIQNIPSITAGSAQIDWPREWDQVLMEGVRAHAYRVIHKENPAVWKVQWDIYQGFIQEIRHGDVATAERPRRVILTRGIRGRRYIPHDNSTDIRRGRY